MGASMQPMQAKAVANAASAQPLVVWFEDCRKESVPLVGGKCSSLGELIHAGVRVPPGFALTTAGFRRFMADAGIAREVASMLAGIDMQDLDALEAASQRIRAMIEAHDFARDIEDEVAECYRKLSLRCGLPAAPVAVRSSATAEDLEDASFAGQQDTYLWVRGVDEVLHHMRKCISSLYTARAIDYRLKHAFDDEQLAISVGVQKMANAYTAGVMFTIHPANGDRSVIVIDSNFGFGESVVSGEVTPDNFVVNKVTLDIIDRTISQKLVCVTVDRKTQTSQTTEVPLERQRVQSLIDDEITELAWMGKRIEKHYGRPMDIEWAVDKDLPAGGNIFILQARPETVWSSRKQAPVAKEAASAMDYILSAMLTGKKLG
ncbi:MAG TPA: PEP/pyruvate-binding domain-containing protein [Burkholderiaceae bacterium]|jgi:pyruvate,water dikinase|nr:PEP/pyruvate-binding domain-containing protein [Burkholderiaceae bacterium]